MRIPVDTLQQCWFLAGPTAVGKTEFSLALAERIGAEILSLDSMAIYRGMDIGAAKPTPEQRARVPHHLIDIADPHEEFSTARYLAAADRAIRDVLSRNRLPLFVGGTGLYLRSLLRGVFEGPAADWEYRKKLEQSAGRDGADWLWRELNRVDPATAAQLHPRDVRRLIRALEIQHLTGQPASRLRNQQPLPPEQRPARTFWLHPPRDWLYRRIDARVEGMFAQGLVAEVEGLLRQDPPLGRTARQGLGYREVIDWLAAGGTDEAAVRVQIQTRTRQFAKRQHTWFRNLEECREILLMPEEPLEQLVDRIVATALLHDEASRASGPQNRPRS